MTAPDRQRLAAGARVQVIRNVMTAQGSYLWAWGKVISDRPESDPMTEVAVEFADLPVCAFHRAELAVEE